MKDPEAKLELLEKWVATVKNENTALKALMDTVSAIGATAPAFGSTTLSGGGTMDDIFRRLKELEDSVDSEVIMINLVPFRSVSDCAKFILAHVPGQRFNTFYNAVSLLYQEMDELVEMKDKLKEDEQLAKTDCLVAEHIVPGCVGQRQKHGNGTHPRFVFGGRIGLGAH